MRSLTPSPHKASLLYIHSQHSELTLTQHPAREVTATRLPVHPFPACEVPEGKEWLFVYEAPVPATEPGAPSLAIARTHCYRDAPPLHLLASLPEALTDPR